MNKTSNIEIQLNYSEYLARKVELNKLTSQPLCVNYGDTINLIFKFEVTHNVDKQLKVLHSLLKGLKVSNLKNLSIFKTRLKNIIKQIEKIEEHVFYGI